MKLIDYRKMKDAFYADLEVVFAKHGLGLTNLGAGIDEHLGTVKLTINLRDVNHKDASGAVTTPERERFKQCAFVYGLDPAMLDKVFNLAGTKYQVAGLKPRGTKCVLIKNVATGKMHVAAPDLIKPFIARAA